MKIAICIFVFSFLSLGVVYCFPPCAFQAYIFYHLNKSELHELDNDFSQVEATEIKSTIAGIPMIWRTHYGAHVYHVSSAERFSRGYNISLVKNAYKRPACDLELIYTEEIMTDCNYDLGDGWVLSYNIVHRVKIREESRKSLGKFIKSEI